jgi:acyl-CoA synthetase (AMP-forming)/AMP-acid ligase II
MIFFSFSGTSLFPKPVGVPAQGLIRNLLQITHSMYTPAAVGDRVLLPVSIHHLFGTLSMYAALLGGATIYSMPKYSVRGLIAAAQGMKVTRLHLTTNLAQVLMTNGSLKGLSQSLRSVVLGGARFDLSVAKLCKEHSNALKFQQSESLSMALW